MKHSKSTAPAFRSLDELREHLGGTHTISKVLIANNGLAAVKGIRSLRMWLYDHIGDEDAVQLCVMASAEDLKANAEFIHMSDQHVEVAGGSNVNNYANVDLILSTALQTGCQAVYPGWGHASENPALPRECEKTRKVTFLGPAEGAMFALGDKIASTIIAQSNGVPTVPWSGDSIRLNPGTFHIDDAVYEKSYIRTAEECVAVCERIGFPVMIKASEGGGGKGIRKVTQLEDVAGMFQAVAEEVKGCHIFVMRMLENVRHLEVQLLADNYGNCIAVRTRDCSVQRRHQKIIEEGPVVGVDQSIIEEMEAAAIRLALAVGYSGLGTVEYMYDKNTNKFSFLELNPRIQVEHPVSELISGVNLPAALLCVGMGIRLDRIPEIRSFYGEDPYDTTVIDFTTRKSLPPRCHAIAVRITAEDVDEGFRPTTGSIDEISFRNSRECWGYFSVPSGGAVHQFADSQFGHIFSTGETREDARRGMVLALRGITVRGEIRTSTAYVVELLERQEFRDCDVNTQWLDGLIAQRTKGIPSAQGVYHALLAASVFRMRRVEEMNLERYMTFLQAGHTPSVDFLSNFHTEPFVLHSQKYTVEMGRVSPNEYCVGLNGSTVLVPCRQLNSGGLQLTISGRTVVAYGEEEPTSFRVTINGKATTFTGDVDPTKLRSSVPGRLVRFLIPDGGQVQENTAYAEVEVMKMILQLRSTVAGTLVIKATAGSTLTVGRLLAEVIPEDASKVARPVENHDPWPANILTPPTITTEKLDSIQRARLAVDTLWHLMNGYHFQPQDVHERIEKAVQMLPSVSLNSVSLSGMNRPFLTEFSQGPNSASPNGKLKAVFDCLVQQYLRVEWKFDGRSRPEAIAELKSSGAEAADIFAADFAHHQEHRHELLKSLLLYMENNRQLMVSSADTLSALSKLQSNMYGAVLLQARYLLRQSTLPSFEERKAELAFQLESGNVDKLMQGSYGFDLMSSVIYDNHAVHLAQLAVELLIRRAHFGVSHVEQIDIYPHEVATWVASYRFRSLGDEHDPLVYGSPEEEATSERPHHQAARLEDYGEGQGFVAVFADEHDAMNRFSQLVTRIIGKPSPLSGGEGVGAGGNESTPSATLMAFFSVRAGTTIAAMAATCNNIMTTHHDAVAKSALFLVTFLVHGAAGGPHIFTFRRSFEFKEDTLYRNLIPTSARRLELRRLINYNLVKFATPHRQVHIYSAQPIKKGPASAVELRMFVRMFVSPRDLNVAPWSCISEVDAGHAMSICVSAMEFARSDKKLSTTAFNHVFINLIELTVDVGTMKTLFGKLAETFWKKLFSLGVREAEIKFKVITDAGYVPYRVQILNHTGHALLLRCYAETIRNGETWLRRIETQEDVDDGAAYNGHYSDTMSGSDLPPSSPSAADDNATPMSIESPVRNSNNSVALQRTKSKTQEKLLALRKILPPRTVEPFQVSNDSFTADAMATTAIASEMRLEPYPIIPPKQVKRLLANSMRTTYVYDWIVLFDVALRQSWRAFVQGRNLPKAAVPPVLINPSQLFVDSRTKQLTRSSANVLQCGMVLWQLEYYPPAYFNVETMTAHPRRIVVVANDITFQSGSFAVPEDVAFKLASDFARAESVPFVYLSANSGARLGLCNEVKEKFRAAVNGDSYEYLYVLEEDYKQLTEQSQVSLNVKRVVTDSGEVRYVILDVIGSPTDYLGVENLQGSALIAGHMSFNYATIPTISVATGRTVGIGAYLVRLGRRVVQTYNSPIILTGAPALNRLLGKEVYSDNCQLGGTQIMVPNGVTHWEVKNDLAAIHKVLTWLNYVPEVAIATQCRPRVIALPKEDPVDRDVTFMPGRDESYDPRCLVQGNTTTTGMFDQGSWMEAQNDWAKTVVVGRAALGGIPCGVILVETRITKKFDPADPADPSSTSSFVSQAGQVWFPDSARKTADALEDFHRERLPCFVLANWRGFSGGMRDMFDEVLKFGASIVDNLRVYNAPVFIYIPPFGELRGGAWVVVDPVINHQGVVEMYCDSTARGGILEPAGVAEIKFREADVRALIRRNEPQIAKLAETDPLEAKKQETARLSLYTDIAVHFADLHDTPGRMKAKRCVVDVVEWKDSRRTFHAKLQRKLAELHEANLMLAAGAVTSLEEGVRAVEEQYVLSTGKSRDSWRLDDRASLAWITSPTAQETLRQKRASLTAESAVDKIKTILQSAVSSKEAQLQCFAALLEDATLRKTLQEALTEKAKEDKL